jgi:hypothetical protein
MGCTPRAVRRRRRTVSSPKRLASWLNPLTGRVWASGLAACTGSAHAAWQVATASGFCWVARPWHRERGLAALAHAGGAWLVRDPPVLRALHPRPQCFVRTKAGWVPPCLLEARADVWRERRWVTTGLVDREEGRCAARLVQGHPASDTSATHAQHVRSVVARGGVSAREQLEQLEARVFTSILVTLQALLQISGAFRTAWNSCTHSVLASLCQVHVSHDSRNMHSAQADFI